MHPLGPRVVRYRTLNAPADLVWAILGDLSRHGDLIPLTAMEAPSGTAQEGDEILARSARFLVDRMTTVRVDSRGDDPSDPGWTRVALFEKTGPILQGMAGVAVRSEGPGRCTALWAEAVTFPVPRQIDRILQWIADPLLGTMTSVGLKRLERVVKHK